MNRIMVYGAVAACLAVVPALAQDADLIAPNAQLEVVGEGFSFTEGPAVAEDGSVYFTDVRESRIHHWRAGAEITLYREETGGANGLFFDLDGNLVACEGDNGRVTAISPGGEVNVLAGAYNGDRFNRPNDLWIHPDGGIYFTDPNYGRSDLSQDGEHVYFIALGGKVTRVTENLVRPNGLIGTPDGETLYIADAGDGKTWRYTVQDDGTLTDKTLFVESGSDGMTMDARGNIYLTSGAVVVYSPAGAELAEVECPESPTNVTFAGAEGKTLFITARSVVCTLNMVVPGATSAGWVLSRD
ncbi:MAG: SMP-30/gluconolactonase/LRE family protein [Armatimonadia bacterium]|nr:SMP-30/gluconolactonase/LRE family protein [Armatimonadia bacterium]